MEVRGHLIGSQFGGHGNNANMVAMIHNGVNAYPNGCYAYCSSSRRKILPLDWQLIDAAYYSNVEEIKSLINSGLDIDSADKDGTTALYEVVRSKNYAAAEFLLQNGATTDKQYYSKKYTVLHMTVSEGDKKMTELLLKYVKDVNLRDKFGNSPLWTAVHQASLDINSGNRDTLNIVELLLQKGADPYTPNWIGKMVAGTSKTPVGESLSPYDSAVRNKLPAILALIEQYAPKPA